jgi:hypothetical protein
MTEEKLDRLVGEWKETYHKLSDGKYNDPVGYMEAGQKVLAALIITIELRKK